MSLLDQTQVASIASCGAEMMKELADDFKVEFAEKTSELKIRFELGEHDKLKSVLHQIKGTSATFGMKSLGEKIAELEQRPIVGTDHDELTSLAELSFKELNEYLESLK